MGGLQEHTRNLLEVNEGWEESLFPHMPSRKEEYQLLEKRETTGVVQLLRVIVFLISRLLVHLSITGRTTELGVIC